MKFKRGELVTLWGSRPRLGIITKIHLRPHYPSCERTTVDVYWFDIQCLNTEINPEYLIAKVDENAV